MRLTTVRQHSAIEIVDQHGDNHYEPALGNAEGHGVPFWNGDYDVYCESLMSLRAQAAEGADSRGLRANPSTNKQYIGAPAV